MGGTLQYGYCTVVSRGETKRYTRILDEAERGKRDSAPNAAGDHIPHSWREALHCSSRLTARVATSLQAGALSSYPIGSMSTSFNSLNFPYRICCSLVCVPALPNLAVVSSLIYVSRGLFYRDSAKRAPYSLLTPIHLPGP